MNPIYNLYAWIKKDDYKKLDLDQMYQDIRDSLARSIDDYKDYASTFLIEDILKMDQEVRVNGATVGSTSIDDNTLNGTATVCPKNRKLKIVHCFESTHFVPIPNSPFKIFAVKQLEHVGSDHTSSTKKYDEDTSITPVEGKVDTNGEAEITLPEAFAGKYIKITFYPNVTQADVKTLLDSYDSTLEKVLSWLDNTWVNQKKEWQDLIDNGMDLIADNQTQTRLLFNELIKVWDDIKSLYLFVSEPDKYYKKLSKYVDDPEKIKEIVEAGDECAQKLFTLLKDEVSLFILFHAMFLRLSLLTPQQLQYIDSVIYAKLLVTVALAYATGGASIYAKAGEIVLDTSSLTSMATE